MTGQLHQTVGRIALRVVSFGPCRREESIIHKQNVLRGDRGQRRHER
jgi:hypothetical protein